MHSVSKVDAIFIDFCQKGQNNLDKWDNGELLKP